MIHKYQPGQRVRQNEEWPHKPIDGMIVELVDNAHWPGDPPPMYWFRGDGWESEGLPVYERYLKPIGPELATKEIR